MNIESYVLSGEDDTLPQIVQVIAAQAIRECADEAETNNLITQSPVCSEVLRALRDDTQRDYIESLAAQVIVRGSIEPTTSRLRNPVYQTLAHNAALTDQLVTDMIRRKYNSVHLTGIV